jgi:dolichol kinase
LAHALCSESVDLAKDLRSFVLSIDPARFRQDLEAAARERLNQLRSKLEHILETYNKAAQEDQRLRKLYEGLRALASQLEYRPKPGLPPGPIQREWHRYQRRLQASYGGLARRLDRLSAPVPALRTTNYGRSLFHLGAALFTLSMIQFILTPVQLGYVGLGFAAWCWLSELGRARFPLVTRIYMKILGPIAHSHEHHKVNSATWFATALAVLAVTVSPMAATVAVAVLGVADPMAALVGRRFGRTQLRGGRTLEGSLAFVFSGTLAGTAVLLAFYPELGLSSILLAAGTAAVLGAVAELVSFALDDNLTIPLAAGLGASLFLGLGF